MDEQQHRAEQRRYWHDVDEEHYRWQGESPYIASEEAALLDAVQVTPGERLLEIGCGEGANLRRLRQHEPGVRLVATDFSHAKSAFVKRELGIAGACADATALPFSDRAFDAVLIRDLLHHIAPSSRTQVLREARRVLRPGGRLTLIEPNGRNPLVLLQAALIRAERGVLRSHAARLRDELGEAGFEEPCVEARQPLPISRLVLHHRFGFPALGAVAPAAWILRQVERAAGLLPRAGWAYLVARAIRRG